MELSTSIAARTYAQARTAAAPQPQPGGPALGGLVENFTDALTEHERTAKAAMTGAADPQALASSQLAVDTVATVRDKVVEAYQEILRMPV